MSPIASENLPKARVLVSADVLLECFTNFNGCIEEAEALLHLIQVKKIHAYITDYCLQKVGFFLSKPDLQIGQEAVSRIRVLLNDRIIHIPHQFVKDAANSPIRNFDAAIEVICATTMNLGAIITQHPDHFGGSSLSTLTTDEFVKRQDLEESLCNAVQPYILVTDLKSFQALDVPPQDNQEFQLQLFGINSRNNLTTLALQDADLRNINLSSMILRGADLRRNNMQGVVLTFASLSFAKLGGTNLREADLRGANLSLAMLSESDLSFANASNSNLSCADLSNAQLCETNLQGADLQGADLQNANLQGANLREAKLKNSNFQDANVTLTKFGQNTGLSEFQKAELINKGAIFIEDKFGERSIYAKL